MLVVTGTIEIAETDVEQATQAAMAMVAATLKEPGCLLYEFSEVLGAPGRFRVYEEWESEAALEAHFSAPHMATFREALSGLTMTSRTIYKITGGRREPL